MSKPIVNPESARTPEYAERLRGILEEGLCPFCPGGYTTRKQEAIKESGEWNISHANPPLPNVAQHFLLFPRSHKEEMTELTTADWEAITELTKWAKETFNMPAGVFSMRSGDLRYTGGSVAHLHAHYLVPAEEDGEIKLVTMNYGPSPRKN